MAWRRPCRKHTASCAAGWRAEDLLSDFPDLASDPALAATLIYREWLLRLQRGEPLTPQDWLRLHPRWRDPLARYFGEGTGPEPTTADERLMTPETDS
jgi:hypothetical protein